MGKDTKIPETIEKEQKEQKQKPRAHPSYQWGITPSEELLNRKVDENHPVHKVPLEKQEKWRKKGIDPVLRAEMDQAMKGKGGLWARVGMTSLGGGWIK